MSSIHEMKAKRKIIISAVVGGALLYVMDGLIYYLLFANDNNLTEVLFTAIPVHELYSRLVLFIGIILFGFIITGFINDLILENEYLRRQQSNNSNDGIDSEFISGLSYQIRTPLNAIVGFSELLKDPNLSMQSKQIYINHIHSSGSYLLQLLNNLTDITRIESNQLSLNIVDTRIYSFFEELRNHFEDRKKETGKVNVKIILNHGIEDSGFTIELDKNRFRQVMTNLLENALKYTDDGQIEFGYSIIENKQLVVYVRDSGQGFSKERLEMILNRYKNLTDNHNQPFDGVALRLTISKNLIKVMGGDLTAESSLGKGSSFQFSLPFSKTEKEITEVEDDNDQTDDIAYPKDWEDKTILIAEDVESNFIYLQELLKPTRAELIWVKNGEEAILEVEKNKKIDLVLMDILMPEMDGYEASRKLKEIRPDLPLIAQTAYSMEGDKNAEAHTFFDDYLIKPIWSPQLLAAIEKHFFQPKNKKR